MIQAEPRQEVVARLARAMKERAAPAADRFDAVATGWAGMDAAIGGLRRRVLHEWLVEPLPDGRMAPPVGVWAHLARRALAGASEGALVVWVGRGCRPYAAALPGALLGRSLYIDPPDAGARVWAMDVALRAAGVGVVVGDGSGLSMSASRRLQVAAGSGEALCLLARPMRERRALSAAWTRWAVHPTPTEGSAPAWVLELVRCKGVRPGEWEAHRWVVHRTHETGDVRLVSDAGDRSDSASRPASRASG